MNPSTPLEWEASEIVGLIHFLTKKNLLIYFINSPSIWRHKHKITSTGCCRPGRYLEVRLRDRHRERSTDLGPLFVSCQLTTIYYAHENSLDKEVEGYYDAGMQVPDYVTLLWADDKYVSYSIHVLAWLTLQISWGNIRRFPTASERNRTGGAGVYYHVGLCCCPFIFSYRCSFMTGRLCMYLSTFYNLWAKS